MNNFTRTGFNDRASSVRPFRGQRYAGEMPAPPAPAPIYEYRRRPEERVREVPVTNVREVLGPPGQRCWVERQQVTQPATSSGANVGCAILGGLVGAILGHQIGGGTGRDIATAGGAVAGAVVGRQQPRRALQPAWRGVDAGRAALRKHSRHACLLRGDVQLPRAGAPRTDDHTSRPNHRRQRQRRTANLKHPG